MRRTALGWLLLALLWAASAPQAAAQGSSADRSAAQFVDESACAGCHAAQVKAWTGSHHDLAMQPASDSTVRGDFRDARFVYGKLTSRFFRRGAKFFVNTDGPDGQLADFEIKHVFGVDPLQQYLIELPGGRLQALSIAWDTRRGRWFHLYPRDKVDHRDELHWTKLSQNWNFMCGECHATDYHKNYDSRSDAYRTTAARFDVGCQGCHGPASRHADWAAGAKAAGERAATRPREAFKRDFDVDLAAASSRAQVDTCARCHSRRGTVSAGYRFGAPLMDSHLPALLSERLYHADGQILDEVYEVGSFLQSRMHAKGVRCSDCHEPHSGRTRAPGNATCTRCHNAGDAAPAAHIDASGLKRKDYDSPQHHFHSPGKPGGQCVDCHAPTRDYMVVHARHDHSFRIPRPDLSVAIATPNACTGCHVKQSAAWAASAVTKWYGPGRRQEAHYGQALEAGRRARPGAVPGLLALVDDAAQPAIVRASALDLLGGYAGRPVLLALQRGLRDADPMVRRAALTSLQAVPPAHRPALIGPLLGDPVRAVRIEAARLLVPAASALAVNQKIPFDLALAEFEAAQAENADRPEAQMAIGNLALSRGDNARAEAAFGQAIKLSPSFVPAHVNLADLYRATGRESDAEQRLREGLRAAPGSAPLHQALGLALVRQGRKSEALAEFAAAVKADPADTRSAYIYALALVDAGRKPEGLSLLQATAKRQGDREVLLALASFSQQAGDRAGAEKMLRTLAAINPGDPAVAPQDAAR